MRTDGRQMLENLMEDLHKTVQRHRVYKPQLLFKTPSPTLEETQNYKPIITTIILSLSMLLAIYIGSQRLLNHQAKNVFQHYSAQIKTDL